MPPPSTSGKITKRGLKKRRYRQNRRARWAEEKARKAQARAEKLTAASTIGNPLPVPAPLPPAVQPDVFRVPKSEPSLGIPEPPGVVAIADSGLSAATGTLPLPFDLNSPPSPSSFSYSPVPFLEDPSDYSSDFPVEFDSEWFDNIPEPSLSDETPLLFLNAFRHLPRYPLLFPPGTYTFGPFNYDFNELAKAVTNGHPDMVIPIYVDPSDDPVLVQIKHLYEFYPPCLSPPQHYSPSV